MACWFRADIIYYLYMSTESCIQTMNKLTHFFALASSFVMLGSSSVPDPAPVVAHYRNYTMRILVIAVIAVFTTTLSAQDYSFYRNTLHSFHQLSLLSDTAVQKNQLNKLWSDLREAHQLPLIVEDSVAFLYRGKANSVVWMGDFNAWGYSKTFNSKGVRLPGTDVWILKASFPKDARLDYKIFIDGQSWILDPENSYLQWSGVGGGSPNSELRMPAWKEDAILHSRATVAKGNVDADLLFNSKSLGYQITYSVYVPAGVKTEKLPVVYVMDGYEYMHPKLGNMVTVVDNLIADKKIKPIVVVFIDHREPVNRSNNRRMDELTLNARYLQFLINEFIPKVEGAYPIQRDPKQRAVLGASVGGLSAAYFAFSRPDVFGLVGIQSPAFMTRPQIFTICNNPTNPPTKISMTSGMINDASEGSRKMKAILETNACVYHYREVNEGASWGNWRGLIDEILVDFFAVQ
jgi:enterochelin esterase-like enzyme